MASPRKLLEAELMRLSILRRAQAPVFPEQQRDFIRLWDSTPKTMRHSILWHVALLRRQEKRA